MTGKANTHRPRLGFLGVGWIGYNRLEAVVRSGIAEIAAIADSSVDAVGRARQTAPDAAAVADFDALLGMDLEGIVIATPSALHAEQSIRALEQGKAVFCQKPLGRNAPETRAAVEAARRADRLLGVDLSYRFLAGTKKMREAYKAGATGSVFAARLVFHNAYGPDKPWYYRPAESGGGCVSDLGIHLVDLALWMLGYPKVTGCSSALYSGGKLLNGSRDNVEDYAFARLDLETGAVLHLECSWNLHAGRDAVIEAVFHGDRGGLALRNVNGSFYDFIAEQYRGTARESLAVPPDEWGGRGVVDWAARLAAGETYSPDIERMVTVSETIDAIYGRNEIPGVPFGRERR